MRERVAEFRDQVERRIDGALTEEEFLPLRLRNGLYLQLHAYMLRIAIPYGTLNARKLRQLAMIADRWDKGYGHITTRTNIQFNWPKLRDVPDILEALADVDMHAIQTSGNCVRNVTADQFAGAAADEIEDPRPTAELLRQWSTDNPEFNWLPRKFKIGITGAAHDRAATKTHDIALRIVRDADGAPGYAVSVGGGLGRTPMIAKAVRDFVPKADLLPYIEAILEVYNFLGRRDNKHKARLKILVHEAGIDEVRARIEAAFVARKATFPGVNAGTPRRDRGGLRAAGLHRAAGRGLRARLCRRPGVPFLGRHQRHRAPARRLRHRHHLAEAGRRHARATSPRRRCGWSPTSPRPTPTTSSARPTSRTWCCRTCRARTCRRCTRRCAAPGSPPPTSA